MVMAAQVGRHAMLVEQRLEALKEEILAAWDEKDCCYKLVVEPEIFWRLGEPPVSTSRFSSFVSTWPIHFWPTLSAWMS